MHVRKVTDADLLRQRNNEQKTPLCVRGGTLGFANLSRGRAFVRSTTQVQPNANVIVFWRRKQSGESSSESDNK